MLRDELLRRFPRLSSAPADAYVVGGAIRDLLLGVDPADVDVACFNPAAAANAIGGRVVRLGTEDHLSAWRVIDGEHVYDFAEMLDHDIDTDLRRREFTINAMAVRLRDGELLDPHGGRADLDRCCVRMVLPENFDDDPLRGLKAVRMAVKLRFELDTPTMLAIRPRAQLINRIAAERVTYELSIIFTCGTFREAVKYLHATALDDPLFGRELDPSAFYADDVTLAGAYALLVSQPKPYAKRWRWSADLLREVTALRGLVDRARSGDAVSLKLALFDAGQPVGRQLPAVLRVLGISEPVEMPDFSLRVLLTGDEIAAIRGITEGPELGRLKRALLQAQVRGEVRDREEAVRFVGSA